MDETFADSSACLDFLLLTALQYYDYLVSFFNTKSLLERSKAARQQAAVSCLFENFNLKHAVLYVVLL